MAAALSKFLAVYISCLEIIKLPKIKHPVRKLASLGAYIYGVLINTCNVMVRYSHRVLGLEFLFLLIISVF